MNAIATIKAGLQQSQMWLGAMMKDIKGDDLVTAPTPNGGNHPLWVLGHLVHSEASMIANFVTGEPNPLAKWDGLFGMKSEADADINKYPPIEEIQATAEEIRASTIKLLDSMTDADFDKKSKAPDDMAFMFGTVGQCFASLLLHSAFHAGQVADARRAMGRKPAFG